MKIINPTFNEWKDVAVKIANEGKCEGDCGEYHFGKVKAVRVFNAKTGLDWGWFSYCENARIFDINNGFELEEV